MRFLLRECSTTLQSRRPCCNSVLVLRTQELNFPRSCCIFNGLILEILIRSKNQHYIPRQIKYLNKDDLPNSAKASTCRAAFRWFAILHPGWEGEKARRKKNRVKSFPLTELFSSALARNEDFIMNNGVE